MLCRPFVADIFRDGHIYYYLSRHSPEAKHLAVQCAKAQQKQLLFESFLLRILHRWGPVFDAAITKIQSQTLTADMHCIYYTYKGSILVVLGKQLPESVTVAETPRNSTLLILLHFSLLKVINLIKLFEVAFI